MPISFASWSVINQTSLRQRAHLSRQKQNKREKTSARADKIPQDRHIINNITLSIVCLRQVDHRDGMIQAAYDIDVSKPTLSIETNLSTDTAHTCSRSSIWESESKEASQYGSVANVHKYCTVQYMLPTQSVWSMVYSSAYVCSQTHFTTDPMVRRQCMRNVKREVCVFSHIHCLTSDSSL